MTQASETWLLDLGNTRAKLARLAGDSVSDVVALAWADPDFEAALAARFAAWPEPARVLVAAVAASEAADRVRRLLPAGAAGRSQWLRSPRRACGVRNAYARPERLGIDRFLALVAVRARWPGGGIVAGCGTALTLDALDRDGVQAAGLIALSPAPMRAALQQATAIADGNPDAFGAGGDDTAMAIRNGCRASAGALVEWFANRQRERMGDLPVIVHGGWAVELAAWLEADGRRAEVFGDAVLQGLSVWAREEPAAAEPG